jgi:sialic acid synthase SpsE/mannose-6-phosphate isomerase-like protein (cupin superfamily)
MKDMFNFDNLRSKELIVLEVANNHQGDLKHGIRLIDEFSLVSRKYFNDFDFAIKFQYRDLSTFVHKQYIDSDIKYVKRFLETKLNTEEWKTLIKRVEEANLITMCTPFDEISVDNVIKDDFEILKIASASIDDWPLVEKIGKSSHKNIIASVGGASIEKIKRFYSYMKNKEKNIALNYCVSLYPTEKYDLNLNYIHELIDTFPGTPIGYSTHESGNVDNSAGLALAAGARIFEKHIALSDSSKGYEINDYSVNTEQYEAWLKNLLDSKNMLGSVEERNNILPQEVSALRGLKRGVFSKDNLSSVEVSEKNIYFSIPTIDNQLLANDISIFNDINLIKDVKKDSPLLLDNLKIINLRNEVENIRDIVSENLKKYNVTVPKNVDLEISHHYGIENFYKFGTCMLTLVNKDYCKKILYQFPGQENPEHFHKLKEETFILLAGDLEVSLNGIQNTLSKGDMLTVEVLQKHSFFSNNGAIFEEISTEHHTDDSFYTDEKINMNKDRKSKILLITD